MNVLNTQHGLSVLTFSNTEYLLSDIACLLDEFLSVSNSSTLTSNRFVLDVRISTSFCFGPLFLCGSLYFNISKTSPILYKRIDLFPES